MFFVCTSKYQKEAGEAELDGHRAWIRGGLEAGTLVSAGRQEPPIGGVVIVKAESREKAEEMIGADPFVTGGVAVYEIVGFRPGVGVLSE